MITALIFGALALVLTGPVPLWFARHTVRPGGWPSRAPAAALVLWQAVALAAVLSAFGCGLAIATELLVPGPDGRPTTNPLDEIEQLGFGWWAVSVLGFIATLMVGARLIGAIVSVAVRTRRRRAWHRDRVDLVAERDATSRHLRVLAVAEPVAYCLPGLRSRVVVSQGILDRLDDRALQAVYRHEESHLRARHDLVLEAFTALQAAFPRVVRSTAALGAVAALIEMLADDSARKSTGAKPLATALVQCADAVAAPPGAMALGGSVTLLRVERLTDEATHRRLALTCYLLAGALLVVPTAAVAVPWLVELNRLVH